MAVGGSNIRAGSVANAMASWLCEGIVIGVVVWGYR